MENIEFDRFASAWKNGDQVLEGKKYTMKEIEQFKSKSASTFASDINKSIIFDLILKSFLFSGILMLIWLFQSNHMLVSLLVTFGIALILMLVGELQIRKNLQSREYFSTQVNKALSSAIDFFHSRFPKLVIMIACSHALLVWVGSLFYTYFKYGEYKEQSLDDLIVSFLMVAIAFSISYFAYSFQYKEQVYALEENLAMIDDMEVNSLQIEKQLKRKRILKQLMYFVLALGTIMFIFLVIRYFTI